MLSASFFLREEMWQKEKRRGAENQAGRQCRVTPQRDQIIYCTISATQQQIKIKWKIQQLHEMTRLPSGKKTPK